MTVQEYLAWFDDTIQATKSLYAFVPSDKLDWRPTENSFSLGQLIEHIPRALWFNAKVIASEDVPLKSLREILVANRRQPGATVDEAVQHLVDYSSRFRQILMNLGEEKFKRSTVNTPQWGALPVWRFAIFTLEHHLNHKMELHMDLRLLGVKVNTLTLYSVRPNARPSDAE